MTTPQNPGKVARATALDFIELLRALDPEMPLGAARCLILIASQQGLAVMDLEDDVGIGTSSASRYHHYLGKANRHSRDGLGLVSASVNTENRRKKFLKLTPKGRRVVGQLVGVLSR